MSIWKSKKSGIIILITAIAIFAGATTVASLPGAQDDSPAETPQDPQDREITSSAEYLRSLRAKEAELNRREKDLLQREQQIMIQERELSTKIEALEKERQEFETYKQQWQDEQDVKIEAAEAERIRSLAASFKSIKSGTAAAQLMALFDENKTTALLILNHIDNRTLGKIFSKISDPEKAAEIYEAIKNWNISVDEARKIVETGQDN